MESLINSVSSAYEEGDTLIKIGIIFGLIAGVILLISLSVFLFSRFAGRIFNNEQLRLTREEEEEQLRSAREEEEEWRKKIPELAFPYVKKLKQSGGKKLSWERAVEITENHMSHFFLPELTVNSNLSSGPELRKKYVEVQ